MLAIQRTLQGAVSGKSCAQLLKPVLYVHQVGAQGLSVADVERLHMEKSKGEEVLRGMRGQREVLDKEAWELELKVEKRFEDLEGTVRQYHSMADRLKLVPSTAKRAEGVEYEIQIDRDAAGPEEMVTADLKGMVRPGLQAVSGRYMEKMRETSKELLHVQEEQDASDERLVMSAEENAILDAEVGPPSADRALAHPCPPLPTPAHPCPPPPPAPSGCGSWIRSTP